MVGDDVVQALAADVRVDLGGRDVGMTEHGLHRAEVGAPFEEVRREAMAQFVRVDVLHDPRDGRVSLDVLPERLSGEWPTAHAEEHHPRVHAARLVGPSRTYVGEVVSNRCYRDVPERDDPALLSLAECAQESGLELEVLQIQSDQLADAESRRVHRQEHRLVADLAGADGLDAARRGEEPKDLVPREHRREPATELRAIDELRGVHLHFALAEEPAVESADRAEGASLRASREPLTRESHQESGDILRPRFPQRDTHVSERGAIAPEVPRVRLERVRAQSTFDPQMIQEGIDEDVGVEVHVVDRARGVASGRVLGALIACVLGAAASSAAAEDAVARPQRVAVDAHYEEESRELEVDYSAEIVVREGGTLRLWMYLDRLAVSPGPMDELSTRWIFPGELDRRELEIHTLALDGAEREVRWDRHEGDPRRSRDAAGGDLILAEVEPGTHSLRMRFSLRLPRRFGRVGQVDDRVALLGPWWPLVVQGDTHGFVSPHEVDFTVRGEREFVFGAETTVTRSDEGTRYHISEEMPWLAAMGADRWDVYETRVRGRRLRVYSPRGMVRPADLDPAPPRVLRPTRAPSPSRDLPALDDQVRSDVLTPLRDAFAGTLSTAAHFGIGGVDLDVVIFPSRTELAGVAPGLLLVSDRAYEITPVSILQHFHDRPVREAMFQELLAGLRVDALTDRAASRRLRATLLFERDLARRGERLRTPREIASSLGFFRAFDQLLYAPQVAFVGAYFGVDERWRDAPASARAPLASGARIAAQAREVLGDGRMNAWTGALLRGRRMRASLREVDPAASSRLDTWLAEPGRSTNYALGEIVTERDEGGYRTRVEVRREGDSVWEPVVVELEDSEGRRTRQTWDAPGERGELTFRHRHPRARLRLDPDGMRLQSDEVATGHPRGDDFEPLRWRPPVFGDLRFSYNPVERRVNALFDFVLRRRYELDDYFGLLLRTNARRSGGLFRYIRGLGAKRDTNGRVWQLSAGVLGERLHAGEVADQLAGWRAGVELVAQYDDQRYYLDPRTGYRLRVELTSSVVVDDAGVVSGNFIPHVRGNATFPLGTRQALVLVGDIEAAFGNVLEAQRPRLSGRFALRGYQVDELRGRARGFATLEYRVTPPFLGDLHWNLFRGVWIRGLQLVGFVAGGVLLDDRDGLRARYGAEAGAGLRVHFEYAGVQPGVIGLDFAFPILRDDIDQSRSPLNVVVALEQYL